MLSNVRNHIITVSLENKAQWYEFHAENARAANVSQPTTQDHPPSTKTALAKLRKFPAAVDLRPAAFHVIV